MTKHFIFSQVGGSIGFAGRDVFGNMDGCFYSEPWPLCSFDTISKAVEAAKKYGYKKGDYIILSEVVENA